MPAGNAPFTTQPTLYDFMQNPKKFKDRSGKISNNTYARWVQREIKRWADTDMDIDPQSETNLPEEWLIIDTAEITLHGSVIARLEYITNMLTNRTTSRLYITDAGYNSVTTRGRLNTILKANNVPFYVVQQGEPKLLSRTYGSAGYNYWEVDLNNYGQRFANFIWNHSDGWVNI